MLNDLQEQSRTLLTIPDAAALLSVSTRSIKRWLASGDLPCVRVNEGQRGRRVLVSDLEDFIATRRGRAANGKDGNG